MTSPPEHFMALTPLQLGDTLVLPVAQLFQGRPEYLHPHLSCSCWALSIKAAGWCLSWSQDHAL